MRIFIDADACPVRSEAIKIAQRHEIKTFIVSNGEIRPTRDQLTETVLVCEGPDEADKWIILNIKQSDILVTADLPLAYQAIQKSSFVVSYDGKQINGENISGKLATRNLLENIREADPLHLSSSKFFFSKKDRIRFMNLLEKLIQTIKKSL